MLHEQPQSGTMVAERITLFHDARTGRFSCTAGQAPLLKLDTGAFDGSYLSLAVAVPKATQRALRPGGDLVLDLDATASRPGVLFVRLKLRSPEKTDTLYETVIVSADPHEIVFAMDAVRVPFELLETVWFDLIFSDPAESVIEIGDLSIRFEPLGL